MSKYRNTLNVLKANRLHSDANCNLDFLRLQFSCNGKAAALESEETDIRDNQNTGSRMEDLR